MPTVLFVCEGNIHRSQIAEAFFNARAPEGWQAVSAGTLPRRDHVHPGAVALMKELGIDIAGQKPKLFDPAIAALAWRVISMCELQGCPTEVLERTERWPIIDPAHLPEERWREIRDEIGQRVDKLLDQIRKEVAGGSPTSPGSRR
jgi:protein-tyrosine-phosphatase